MYKKRSKKRSKKTSRTLRKTSIRKSKKRSRKTSIRKSKKSNVRKASKKRSRKTRVIKGSKKRSTKTSVRKTSVRISKKRSRVSMKFSDNSKQYIIFRKDPCTYSLEALKMLQNKMLSYVDKIGKKADKENKKVMDEIKKFKEQHPTWPKIYLKEGEKITLIGGCDDLKKHLKMDNKNIDYDWIVYTKSGCSTCKEIKNLEKDHNIDKRSGDGKSVEDLRKELKTIDEKSINNKYWPKVFKKKKIGKYEFIGNFTEMKTLLNQK